MRCYPSPATPYTNINVNSCGNNLRSTLPLSAAHTHIFTWLSMNFIFLWNEFVIKIHARSKVEVALKYLGKFQYILRFLLMIKYFLTLLSKNSSMIPIMWDGWTFKNPFYILLKYSKKPSWRHVVLHALLMKKSHFYVYLRAYEKTYRGVLRRLSMQINW